MQTSTISAFQKILSSFAFQPAESFGEDFAQKRYLKKMEVPDETRDATRKKQAWTNWISHDSQMVKPALLPGNWYKARLECHKALKSFHLGPLSFSNGSEFFATKGENSIEAKLSRSEWSCTPDNFDLWAITAYENRCLKIAVRKRFRARVATATGLKGQKLTQRISAIAKESYSLLFSHLPTSERKFAGFKRMLRFVTIVENGNRFSTVRKNNTVDRPICLEHVCNMLVQRRIGIGLRDAIKTHFGIDLRTLANHHRVRIMAEFHNIATIDLKNASDSVWLYLSEFMLTPKVFRLVNDARAPFTLGLNGQFHGVNKVSSMGNGFTFELMTLLLLCLCRQHDQGATVFGDDIIIDWTKAYALIRDLSGVGFQVNSEKSFVHGDFRESCGANYHWRDGYIESYDFEYPVTIHDCTVLYAKVKRLSHIYPSFKKLEVVLSRSIPKALRGSGVTANAPVFDQVELPGYFQGGAAKAKPDRWIVRFCQLLQLEPSVRIFPAWLWEPRLATPTPNGPLRPSRHYAKILQYLHGGRITDDEVTGQGKWVKLTLIEVDGRVMRLSSVRNAVLAELKTSMIQG